MGLFPEFFVLLGIVIFLAMSLLSFLLQDHLPSLFQYVFQIAGGGGFGVLFLNQGLPPTDPTHFSISVGYLACALSSVLGLNVYLLLVRKKMAVASTFSGTVTMPILMISALLISSYLGNAGEVSVAPVTIAVLAVVALVTNLGIFIFLRKLSRQATLLLAKRT